MNVSLNMLSMITLKVLHKSFYDIFYMKQVVILYTPRLVTQFPPLIVRHRRMRTSPNHVFLARLMTKIVEKYQPK